MGGEAEDTYDENADIWYFNASVSLQLRADWEIHVPLPLTISRVVPTTKTMDEAVSLGYKPSPNSIVGDGPNRLFFATVPVLAGRNNAFERIA